MQASLADLIIGFSMWFLPIAALVLFWVAEARGKRRSTLRGRRTPLSYQSGPLD